jgi:predicted alpha/beta-fold hydrolase
MSPEDAVTLSSGAAKNTEPRSTREWLDSANRQLSNLLPQGGGSPLLTEQLVRPPGTPVDVFNHFGINPDGLQNLIMNFRGLKYTAQAASRNYFIEQQAPPWPGFEDTWIPIQLPNAAELSLSGRLGYARDAQGNIKDATCLVILPGMFGDHGVQRSRDLAIPLREAGFHVLDLELRGHGQTEARYPRMYHTFGVFETDDLMQVSDWLEHQPHVRRTGLLGYCWNANIALLAAWYDGSRPDDPLISSTIRRNLVAYDPHKRRFSAGIMALSPVVRGEVLMDELDHPRSRWKHPIYAAIQDTVRDRMQRKGYPVTGSLPQLMDDEYDGYNIPMTHGLREGYPMLRLIAYKNQSDGNKLECARMPVIIMHGADDPLVPAQDIADLVAGVENPRVAALVLPSGGHVGFAGYAPKYYFSLIVNFFDPLRGAAAGPQ